MLQVMRVQPTLRVPQPKDAENHVNSPSRAPAGRIPAAAIEGIHYLPVLPNTRQGSEVWRVTLRHILVALTLLRPSAAAAQSAAVQPIAVRVDAPARVGLPIWVHADLQGDLTVRYPFAEDPRYFGSNHLELKREGQSLVAQPGFSRGGLMGRVVGSIAPLTSPQNRLPLHLGFVIDRPGRYSVRWSVMGNRLDPGPPPSLHQELLAQSEWLDFDVGAPSPPARETWLAQLLRAPPTDAGAFVGDYLPSLLAAAPDRRVARALIDATYSSIDLITSCALAGLRLFPAELMVPLTIRTLQERGPSSSLAYFVSWNASWFQDRRVDIIRTSVSSLKSNDDAILVGSLELLGFARHFDWSSDAPLREADRAVKGASPRLMARSDRVAQQLAVTLGGTKDPEMRELLNQIAAQHPGAREQALIALRWIGEPAPQVHERAGSSLSQAVSQLQSASSADRKSGSQALIDLARRSPQEKQNVGAYLVNDVIRQPESVNADTWRDAALILGRVQSPLASTLTLYLERAGAVAALIEASDVVLPAVNDVLKVGGPARRRLAAQVLGAMGVPAAGDALKEALKTESDAGVKRALADALAHFGRRPPPAEIR
jgi:hypothetical protein